MSNKRKTYNEYIDEYRLIRNPLLVLSQVIDKEDPSTWLTKDKIGFLWYMIEMKGGNILDFIELCNKIISPHKLTGKIVDDVYKLLPKDFIEAFKKGER
jgi:hypothetical protein